VATLSKMVVAYEITEEHLGRLRQAFPDIEFVHCKDDDELPNALRGAQALVGRFKPDLPLHYPELRWLQSISAGMDKFLIPELIDHDVVITNFSGVQAPNMAEHLVALMLVFARGLPRLMHNQVHGRWTSRPPEEGPSLPQTVFYTPYTAELGKQTLAIAGLGDIGCELAWRASCLGMRVIGSKRRPVDAPKGVDRLYGPEDWREMLPEADHVAICLPLTNRTHQLFGAAEFKVMKPTSFIYNTSRGTIIDQDALIEALRNGDIAGAGLDVTTPEPLPPESPLWNLPNVVITCHTSGASPHTRDRGVEIVLENIRRFRDDRPMVNVVDKREGY
jgi:phosphoglycerate dehydrogenase-like enzyme